MDLWSQFAHQPLRGVWLAWFAQSLGSELLISTWEGWLLLVGGDWGLWVGGLWGCTRVRLWVCARVRECGVEVVTGDPGGEEGFIDTTTGTTSMYPPPQLFLLFFQLPRIPWSSQNNRIQVALLTLMNFWLILRKHKRGQCSYLHSHMTIMSLDFRGWLYTELLGYK